MDLGLFSVQRTQTERDRRKRQQDEWGKKFKGKAGGELKGEKEGEREYKI